ncbi:MAG: hypothetical protein IJH34_07575 [Romboutsia sp.]|nr:hypothetical protein [Romboutsia sp.]
MKMKKNNKLIIILGLVTIIGVIAGVIIYNTNKNTQISSQSNTPQEKKHKQPPNFENMTEEEKAEFEKNRPKKPDFENMTEEEKAEFEKNRPKKPDSKENTKEDSNKEN